MHGVLAMRSTMGGDTRADINWQLSVKVSYLQIRVLSVLQIRMWLVVDVQRPEKKKKKNAMHFAE